MSEYQYYEFRTIDQPLTPEQLKYVRGLSTRAEITPTRFTNTYHYGDFGGRPRRLMEDYYDAHVYVSNFGSLHFMLRLPRNVVPEATLKRYASEEALEWWTTETHTLLDWILNEDGGSGDWMEGEGWLDRLLPIRDELVRGDYRSLYIGWLGSVAGGSYEDDEDEEYDDEYDLDEEEDEETEIRASGRKEPPVPDGLKKLTDAQEALAEFLGVGRDLLAAAAAESVDVSSGDTSQQRTEWVARLPEAEVRALLSRILAGDALQIQTELRSRYYRALGEAAGESTVKSGRRTAAELLALAEQAENARKQQAAQEKERKRQAHLKGLVARLPEMWTSVKRLAEEQKAVSYDKVRDLLVEMRDAYEYADRRAEFDREFAPFLQQYSRSTALVRRLKAVDLIP